MDGGKHWCHHGAELDIVHAEERDVLRHAVALICEAFEHRRGYDVVLRPDRRRERTSGVVRHERVARGETGLKVRQIGLRILPFELRLIFGEPVAETVQTVACPLRDARAGDGGDTLVPDASEVLARHHAGEIVVRSDVGKAVHVDAASDDHDRYPPLLLLEQRLHGAGLIVNEIEDDPVDIAAEIGVQQLLFGLVPVVVVSEDQRVALFLQKAARVLDHRGARVMDRVRHDQRDLAAVARA